MAPADTTVGVGRPTGTGTEPGGRPRSAGPGTAPGAAVDDTPTRTPTATRTTTGRGLADLGSAVPDSSELAERTRRAERSGVFDPRAQDTRSQRIDETITRLDAAHAGLPLPRRDSERGTERGTGSDTVDGGEDQDVAAPPKRRLPRPGLVKVLVLALAAVVFGSTAAGAATQDWLGSAVVGVAALDEESGAIVDAAAQRGDQNVLVVATGQGATVSGPRPDTVVVAHIPAGGAPMTVLSVPSDLQVDRPSCERFDPATAAYTTETVPAQARTRLAGALDAGGPRCATRVVQQLTGLAITQYVGLDLDRLGAVVDAASGVQVCVSRPVLDRELGPVAPDPGTVTLDGRHAADFVRAADVDGDPPADLGRIERQQQVLAAVLDPTLSTTGLLDVPRVAALRSALGAALTSDGARLDGVLALASTLRGLEADGVAFRAVPTTSPVNGGDGAVLRGVDASALFSALRTHTPLPAAAATASDTGPTPGDLRVQILNASDAPGRAGKVGDTLRQLGFGIGPVTNADRPTPQTVIRYSPDQAAAATLLAATVPSATLVPDPGATGMLQLVLGRSFDSVIKAPAQPATPAPAAPPQAAAGCA